MVSLVCGPGIVVLLVITPSWMGFSQTKYLGVMVGARLAFQAQEPILPPLIVNQPMSNGLGIASVLMNVFSGPD